SRWTRRAVSPPSTAAQPVVAARASSATAGRPSGCPHLPRGHESTMALDFSFTPEQEEIRALAHEFAEKEMRPQADYYDEHEETPWEVMRKAHDLGIGASAAFPVE